MPRKPKRPCSYRGCPALTDNYYCDEHKKLMDAHYDKYERDPAHAKRYGRAWKRIRDRHISAHPVCEQCKAEGKVTPANEVHHVLPLSKGGTHASSNLRSLCTSCHRSITARDGDRWKTR